MADPEQSALVPKPIAFGNIGHGTIAFGNVVSGFVAVGNVARGFIAIGNVAIGFVAIGNVAFGGIAIGATNACGLVAGSFLNVLPGLVALGGMNVVPVVPFGFTAIALLVAASFLVPGERTSAPGVPTLTSMSRLLNGKADEGWIRIPLEEVHGGHVSFFLGGKMARFRADPDAVIEGEALLAKGPRPIEALVSWRAEREAESSGYREGETRRVLVCRSIRAAPAKIVPWANPKELQWWLARGARVGATVAAVVWLVLLIRG